MSEVQYEPNFSTQDMRKINISLQNHNFQYNPNIPTINPIHMVDLNLFQIPPWETT